MRIKSFVCNRNQTNTYVISDEMSHETIIVDCGCCSDFEFSRISKYIDEEKLIVKHSFCTHLHFDHMWGQSFIHEKYGIETIASTQDKYNLEWNRMCSVFMNMTEKEKELLGYNSFIWLSNTFPNIYLGDMVFDIISSPGHSLGSISLYNELKGVLFCGDVIFENGYGRTDFEGGNIEQLKNSIKEILNLPNKVIVFPGHGNSFTVGERKQTYKNYTL